MTEKENGNALQILVQKEIHIDKNDIANIAIAEAELKIKRTIKDLKEQLAKVEKDVEAKQKQLVESTETLMRNIAETKASRIRSALSELNKKKKEWNFSVKAKTQYPSDHRVILIHEKDDISVNSYAIELLFEDERSNLKGGITIEKGSLPLFPAQIKIAKELEALSRQQEGIMDESLKWRHKLSDIPAMERQMRAAIAKRQLSQTKEGKDIIEELLKSLDSEIKMLGI